MPVLQRIFVIFFFCTPSLVLGWSSSPPLSRRNAMKQAIIAAGTAALVGQPPLPANAAAAAASEKSKLLNLQNEDFAKYITKDVEQGQFMVTADISRELYDESATFTDEIDTYDLVAWVKGTKRLFVADKSHVDLVPNTLQVSDAEATFLFTETLMFNIPLLRPTVYLTGKVILKRDPGSGLITSYREFWDQDVSTVLKSAKYGS
jgi:hypothetical protein